MTINSEQIQALKAANVKPVGKFILVMSRWHHIWHGEAQHTEPRKPLVKLYSEETVSKLLTEREADKALIAESVVLFETLRQRIAELEAIRAAAEKLVRCKGRYHSEQNYRALAALFGVSAPDLPPLDSEARTVTVKLPDSIPCPTAPEIIWLQTNGDDSDESKWPESDDDVSWCREKIFTNDTLYVRADLAAAGVTLDVGE